MQRVSTLNIDWTKSPPPHNNYHSEGIILEFPFKRSLFSIWGKVTGICILEVARLWIYSTSEQQASQILFFPPNFNQNTATILLAREIFAPQSIETHKATSIKGHLDCKVIVFFLTKLLKIYWPNFIKPNVMYSLESVEYASEVSFKLKCTKSDNCSGFATKLHVININFPKMKTSLR